MLCKADHGPLSHAILDTVRDPVNTAVRQLSLENPDAEFVNTPDVAGYNAIDFLSTGYKMRSYNGTTNWPDKSTCYLAFGRPIGGVCVAPATAR
jgi:hypothetical protein